MLKTIPACELDDDTSNGINNVSHKVFGALINPKKIGNNIYWNILSTQSVGLRDVLWTPSTIIGITSHLFTDSFTYIFNVAILPEYQSKGYGTALMQYTIDNSPKPIYIDIYKNNERVIPFYKRLGFTIEETIPKEFASRENDDVFYMKIA